MSGSGTTDVGSAAPRRRRARWWIAGAAACAVALTGTGIAAANVYGSVPAASEEKKRFSTASVEEGTLSGSQTVSGTLDYTASRNLSSGIGGVLTAVSPAGSQVGLGQPLFSVDNVSVFLFHGDLPAWRAFERGMSAGPDVRQLEADLQALGYFSREPDEKFDGNTEAAIRAWQEATGQEKTGRIDLGRIIFAPTDLRIAEVLAAIGDQVGPGAPVVKVSGLVKEVTANLKLADQKLGVVGTQVNLQLPGGITTTGTITAVGQPTEQENNGQKSIVVPITIALDDPAAADGIQRASVAIDVPSETRDNVLSVPVEALIALPGGRFGVQVVDDDGTIDDVPVETGLFAGGRVEISGEGVKAGLDVVVPER
ncbi:efflux RND transporter periplasmic adaptor subunit [Microbacterium sp. 179-I 3D3 NHS]|uniref:efflux RND transporter periplasmic adaptor subunit n=1 Tax=Microbacterium sp. 179-I 3D3 NHS TaxID=3142382 RepID=UPI00399F7639